MPKNPKNEVNTPKVVLLVTVKYRNKAPIMVSSKPENFSASDTQKVPSSLILSPSFFDVLPT
jgi:hypothetical protein